IGQDCLNALSVANKNVNQLRQAFDNMQRIASVLSTKGMSAGWLMAIGLRESGAGDFMKEPGGKGRGWYQIDLGQHPQVSETQAMNFEWATGFVSDLLNNALTMVSNYENNDRK